MSYKDFNTLSALTKTMTDDQRGIQQARELHTGQHLHYRLANQHPALTGNRRNRDALVWIYEGASLKLDRKFQKFVQFWL